MPVPGPVFQMRSPDLTGRDDIQGERGRGNRERGGEAETAAGTTEGEREATDDANTEGERDDRRRGGQVRLNHMIGRVLRRFPGQWSVPHDGGRFLVFKSQIDGLNSSSPYCYVQKN